MSSDVSCKMRQTSFFFFTSYYPIRHHSKLNEEGFGYRQWLGCYSAFAATVSVKLASFHASGLKGFASLSNTSLLRP